jgi:hypothetical protein
MVENLNPSDFYRTDDMAMATFLKMEGHSPQQIGFLENDDNCYWWFRINDDLTDAVDCFNDGEASVEPREWARNFHNTRKQMFACEKSKVDSPTASAGDAVEISA